MSFCDTDAACDNELTITSSVDPSFSATLSRDDAKLSAMIVEALQVDPSLATFDLNYSAAAIQLVIDFLKDNKGDLPPPIPAPLPDKNLQKVLRQSDFDFIERAWAQGKPTFIELGKVSLFFNIEPLTALISAKWASLIMGKSIAESKLIFDPNTPI